MKPIRTFLQQTSIKALLKAEKPIYDATHGRHAKNRFLSSVKIPFVGTRIKILKETDDSYFIAKYKEDGTIDDGDFKILATTDLHLDEDYGVNDKTLQMFVYQVEKEKPDLVIFTGDVILSKYQQIDAVQFAELMEKLGVYYAYVFGNHEAREEKGYFKYLIFNSLTKYPHCLSKYGDKSLPGYGNFTINIMNSETDLKESLIFFDSGRDMHEPHITNNNVPRDLKGYDYIKPSQIRWYENHINELKKEYNNVQSMLYMHIPIPEYKEVFDAKDDGTFVPSGKAEILYGNQFEGIGCSPYNSHLFEAMKRCGSQGIFVGHDHVNDFAAIYDGIYLVYNQCGGYNCYNISKFFPDLPESEWVEGATITTVRKDGSIELRQSFNSQFLSKF